jgi:hypothetical protein
VANITSVGLDVRSLTGMSEMDRVPPPWRRPPRRPSRRSAGSQFVHPCRQRDGRPSDGVGGLCDPGASRLVTLTVPFSDTAAASSSFGIAPAPGTVLQITSGATRVARYARESAERGSPSSSSPPAGARSTAHAGSTGHFKGRSTDSPDFQSDPPPLLAARPFPRAVAPAERPRHEPPRLCLDGAIPSHPVPTA